MPRELKLEIPANGAGGNAPVEALYPRHDVEVWGIKRSCVFPLFEYCRYHPQRKRKTRYQTSSLVVGEGLQDEVSGCSVGEICRLLKNDWRYAWFYLLLSPQSNHGIPAIRYLSRAGLGWCFFCDWVTNEAAQ